jgi:hypothetical protein
LGEHEQCASAIACALGEERVFGIRAFELYDSMRVHPTIHIEDDFEWNAGGLSAEVHDVLHASSSGDGTSGHIRFNPDEHVAREERLKAGAPAHEGEEREKVLAPEIELDPPLRARLSVYELPGSIAERRHVGVVHGSDFIHNEGDVQSASGMPATLSPEGYTDGGTQRTIK